MELPELEDLRRRIYGLRADASIVSVNDASGALRLAELDLDGVTRLLALDEGYWFLMAAAQLNRSSLRQAAADSEAQLVAPRQRKAFAVRVRLPVATDFETIAESALRLRQADLQRKARGRTEQWLQDRLRDEGIPLLMSPPRRVVPGVLIAGRKPDGVWPDPATGAPPVLYLEVKRIRRVADDIQKRLYELAEAALEMKLLYGQLTMRSLSLADNREASSPETAERLRTMVTGRPPFVVGLFLCPRDKAERYRTGAHALIDRIFFEEEIDECLSFLDEVIRQYPTG